MRYQISGKQLDIGDALQQHVRTELDEIIAKYAGRPTSAVVSFSRIAHEFSCEVTVHLSTGLIAQSRGRDAEIYAAFAKAAERMGKQLRRAKRRLKDHYAARPQPVELLAGSAYILAPIEDSDETENEAENTNPTIVADMQAQIPALSVGEAVMQMELADIPVLMFQNEKHGGLNVVYRRDDGNIGWIDPRNSGL
ncbi:ribosomal subunit interface protein [Ketogulonicigenium robustum]|uniref:Ribosome hibernation promoting factor n=1 Tax=Ketogulonicigenium robustum TaxID=92947 RepID=A0A1W6P2L3_9RHOB|nr:ribosome-associated translation inhibitor RaiA [Ketogulonicigenium robustum]ARO15631.1 ribosomal subunit interface protein [Ketogulonicigenium robustum]